MLSTNSQPKTRKAFFELNCSISMWTAQYNRPYMLKTNSYDIFKLKHCLFQFEIAVYGTCTEVRRLHTHKIWCKVCGKVYIFSKEKHAGYAKFPKNSEDIIWGCLKLFRKFSGEVINNVLVFSSSGNLTTSLDSIAKYIFSR